MSTVQLPTDRPRGTRAPRCTAVAARTLPAAYEEAFGSWGTADVPGPRAALLAGYAALLHRWCRQDDFVVPIRASSGTEYLTGFSLTDDHTLRAMARITDSSRVAGSGPGGVGICFTTEDARESGQPREAELVVFPAGDAGRRVELHYDSGLFTPATADLFLQSYEMLLTDALAVPDRPVSRLRLLSDADEQRVLVEWNDTAASLPHAASCLHEVFEEQAARRPDAVALVQGTRRFTYSDVNLRANRLAHHLRGLGVGRDTRVGLCLDRSPDLLVAVLAVLKAGGAYVPLDPAYPADRLAVMVRGADCAVVVSRAGLTDNLPRTTAPGVRLLLLDRDAAAIAAEPSYDPRSGTGPEDLCYIIYTSGSTGTPKPIALRHRGVLNNLMDLNSRFGVGSKDRVMALSSPSFDMSVYEFLGTTTAGGTVVVPSPDRAKEPQHWAELAAAHGVTVWNSAPALLELFMDYLDSRDGDASGAAGELRLVLLGGDWVPLTLPGRVGAVTTGLRFVVLGGATEASIHSTVFEVDTVAPEWRSIPYGRPMANQRTYILDENHQPVPPGVTGELYLAGTGLARGYLDQPARTTERFLEWSWGRVTGERLYRTGDLARFGPDGLIELIGRADFQVKVNGLRLELGEIEAKLRDHPEVKDAVVVAHPDAVGKNPRLVGYVVPRPGSDVRSEVLREHLGSKLPPYMVPGTVLLLPALPLTPNGKVDRKALPAPERLPGTARATGDPDAPAPGSWEERIASVWQEVLGLPLIGRDDDFFALGGDSMKALRSMMRIHSELKWADTYRHPTLDGLAAHLRSVIGAAPDAEPDRSEPSDHEAAR